MRKTVLTIYLALILIPALAFGYQFEDYVWGTPKAKIKKQLGLKKRSGYRRGYRGMRCSTV